VSRVSIISHLSVKEKEEVKVDLKVEAKANQEKIIRSLMTIST